MFQDKNNLGFKILLLTISISVFSCNEKHLVEVYNLDVSKLKLSSISKDGSLTIYPFIKLNESEIIKIDESFSSKEIELKHFVSNEVQFLIIDKINNFPINLYNTIIIDNIPYSPIIVYDSKLTKSENYYLNHIIRNVLFEDLKKITRNSATIKYCDEDFNCDTLSPLIVSLKDKKQFSLIHFSNSNHFIETKRDILIKYLKGLKTYLHESGVDSKNSGHLGNSIVLALNELDDSYDVDPL